MSELSFAVSQARVERAADTGLARAAETLATALRARGLRAAPAPVAGGRVRFSHDSFNGAQRAPVRLQIEGAGIVAREFGTLTREAAPIVAPVVRAHAQEIVRLMAAEIRSPK